MARILRGEIRWADLKPVQGKEQARRRPVLDLVMMSLTSGRGLSLPWRLPARLSGRVFLTLELRPKGLPKKFWMKVRQMRTLAVEQISGRLGRVGPEELIQVIEGLSDNHRRLGCVSV